MIEMWLAPDSIYVRSSTFGRTNREPTEGNYAAITRLNIL